MKVTIEKSALKFLIILLSADLLFIAFHIGHLITTNETDIVVQGNSVFSLGKDMGMAESYQYVKEFWIIILLAYLAWIKREVMYLSWSVFALYLLADDLFQLHERFGRMISQYFEMDSVLNLRAQDFGELAVVAIAGGVLFLFIALAYWKSSPKLRTICHHFIFLIFTLVIFGVVFDMVQIMFLGNDFWWNIFGTIEDGGEMFVMSIFCWYVFYLSGNDEPILFSKSPKA